MLLEAICSFTLVVVPQILANLISHDLIKWMNKWHLAVTRKNPAYPWPVAGSFVAIRYAEAMFFR